MTLAVFLPAKLERVLLLGQTTVRAISLVRVRVIGRRYPDNRIGEFSERRRNTASWHMIERVTSSKEAH
jgi:hypothetical protein